MGQTEQNGNFSLDMAPFWRHNDWTSIRDWVMSARKHSSIRVESEIMDAIERACSKRPGNVSTNQWIVEAVTEKLARDGIAIMDGGDA